MRSNSNFEQSQTFNFTQPQQHNYFPQRQVSSNEAALLARIAELEHHMVVLQQLANESQSHLRVAEENTNLARNAEIEANVRRNAALLEILKNQQFIHFADVKIAQAEQTAEAANKRASEAEDRVNALEAKVAEAETKSKKSEEKTVAANKRARVAEDRANSLEVRVHEAETKIAKSEEKAIAADKQAQLTLNDANVTKAKLTEVSNKTNQARNEIRRLKNELTNVKKELRNTKKLLKARDEKLKKQTQVEHASVITQAVTNLPLADLKDVTSTSQFQTSESESEFSRPEGDELLSFLGELPVPALEPSSILPPVNAVQDEGDFVSKSHASFFNSSPTRPISSQELSRNNSNELKSQ